jgi:hypothetical protein
MLLSLCLDFNGIIVEGCASLSATLIINASLKTLTLNSNPLTDRGLIYLTKAISHNNTLSTLEMEGCQITQARRVEQLQSTLFKQQIAARRQLWLRDCSVSDPGARALASCLEQNMSIVDCGGTRLAMRD